MGAVSIPGFRARGIAKPCERERFQIGADWGSSGPD